MIDLSINFCREDFESILEDAGIDPDTVTMDEWRKFTDRFLDGTAWTEVAEIACDAILSMREGV